jgi:ABC-type dipeptide/oligopeptide/nickel transport system ATPase component
MSLFEVKDLSIGIELEAGLKVLTEDISFDVNSGEVVALVGESGSGKTISSLGAIGFYPGATGKKLKGQILFEGQDLSNATDEQWSPIRGFDISMIFQEPASALNPLLKIRKQLEECLVLHPNSEPFEINDLMNKVGFKEADRVLNSYPHELSGGMQQRVMIAMALIHKPKLLIADEPTTALDVTIQAQIMDLLMDLQEETNMGILFISHNLPLVYKYCDRMIVLKDGKEVEKANVVDFFEGPKEEYSKQLLAAIPGSKS